MAKFVSVTEGWKYGASFRLIVFAIGSYAPRSGDLPTHLREIVINPPHGFPQDPPLDDRAHVDLALAVIPRYLLYGRSRASA